VLRRAHAWHVLQIGTSATRSRPFATADHSQIACKGFTPFNLQREQCFQGPLLFILIDDKVCYRL
jgi:hypothetical protein